MTCSCKPGKYSYFELRFKHDCVLADLQKKVLGNEHVGLRTLLNARRWRRELLHLVEISLQILSTPL